MKFLAIAASALALSASPAFAQNSITNWSNDYYDVGGSAPGEDDAGCIMTSTFEIEGRADVDFNVLWDGEKVIFALTSYDWSAEKGREYDGFSYYFSDSDTIFNGGTTFGFVESYAKKGFMTTFDSDFLDRLGAENRLVVARFVEGQDPMIVADLGLRGTADAVAALRRCTTFVLNREAARIRRESRNDYISRDPFER